MKKLTNVLYAVLLVAAAITQSVVAENYEDRRTAGTGRRGTPAKGSMEYTDGGMPTLRRAGGQEPEYMDYGPREMEQRSRSGHMNRPAKGSMDYTGGVPMSN